MTFQFLFLLIRPPRHSQDWRALKRQSQSIRHTREENYQEKLTSPTLCRRRLAPPQGCLQLFPSLSRGCGPPTRASPSIILSGIGTTNLSLPDARGRGDDAGKRGTRVGKKSPAFTHPHRKKLRRLFYYATLDPGSHNRTSFRKARGTLADV